MREYYSGSGDAILQVRTQEGRKGIEKLPFPNLIENPVQTNVANSR